jgi:hypothetical protein
MHRCGYDPAQRQCNSGENNRGVNVFLDECLTPEIPRQRFPHGHECESEHHDAYKGKPKGTQEAGE